MAVRHPTFISANKNSQRSWARYAPIVDYGIAQDGLSRSRTVKIIALLKERVDFAIVVCYYV